MSLTIADAKIAQMHTPEARAKKSRSMRRGWAGADDVRRNICADNLAKARSVRFECVECGRVLPAGPMSRHLKASQHSGKRRLATAA